MTKCYFKRVSESTSKEGLQYRSQFPEILDFDRCLYKCDGYNGCELFAVELNEGLEGLEKKLKKKEDIKC